MLRSPRKDSKPSTAPASPQEKPAIYIDQVGRKRRGVFIEDVSVTESKLLVTGWSFGGIEVALASSTGLVPFELDRTPRSDVGDAFSLKSPEDIGFSLATGEYSEGTECFFCWRSNPAQEFSRSAIRIPEEGSNGDRGDSASPEGSSGIFIDYVAGPDLVGWSFCNGNPAPLDVLFGDRCLGRLVPAFDREDVQAHHQLSDSAVGFEGRLGGVFQFSLLARDCQSLSIRQDGASPLSQTIGIDEYRDQIPTFSPLKAFDRDRAAATIGSIKDIRAINRHECALLFKTASVQSDDNDVLVDAYQEAEPGDLKRVDQCTLIRNGEVAQIDLRLLSIEQPILLVVTNSAREILLTDVIPLPALYLAEHTMLIEYHSVLASGQNFHDTTAKISRNYLNARWRKAAGLIPNTSAIPVREKTAIILFDRQDDDSLPEVDFETTKLLFDTALVLVRNGQVIRESGSPEDLSAILEDEPYTHFVFLDRNASLRPDFWEILGEFAGTWPEQTALAFGDSLIANGLERPCLVKRSILNHQIFRRYELANLNSAIVTRKLLQSILDRYPEDFAGGKLPLEKVLVDVPTEESLNLRVVLDQSITGLTTKIGKYFSDLQQPLPSSPRPAAPYQQTGGMSVIINYRNALDETLRCLDSLSLQEFPGDLEVILVNNGSVPFYSDEIVSHAEKLFGSSAVRAVSYDEPFDHSAQCNLGAEIASQEFLFMLSNDALFVNSNLLAEAREITAVPWVGTCGFRIIGAGSTKRFDVLSLGLGCTVGPYLVAGGPILGGNAAPPFLHDCTIEVAGNTFAAVCIRRETYQALDGLDAVAFPTNYNDVDFCLRATAKGLRHVAIGSCIIEHIGRGSRGIDLELPMNPRILESALSLDKLSRVGTFQL